MLLKGKSLSHSKIRLVLLLFAFLCWFSAAQADRPGWQRQQVNWRLTGGASIKAVNYPKDKPLPTLAERGGLQPKRPRKETRYLTAPQLEPLTQQSTAPIIAIVFDSPPIDGFVPWVAVSVTDARSYMWYDTEAYDVNYVTGNYLTANPESDYAIGIFDTGASASLISDNDAFKTGIYGAGLVTSSPVTLQGVTGDALAWASHPLGIFIDGIDAIEPNGMLIDDSRMAGTTNISVIVGDPIESPNMPTAIGAPMAVFFSTAFCNNRQVTRTIDSNEFTAPYIRFYDHSDSRIPYYSNKIYLELRPTGVGYVQYFPCIEIFPGDCPDGDGSPLLPTIIVDGWWTCQALFFVSSVDLTHKNKSAIDKDGFMFDTGAQVTVISEAIAARLNLNPNNPDFTVEIQGVTGEIIIAPGFYIDLLEIVATPEWLSFTNVPVVMLDVASPEGDYLDGIIGMNLFVDLNFVFKGGGLPGQTAPYIRFDPVCRVTADIAPPCGDCKVDFLDIKELADHWLETPASQNWNPEADLAPQPTPDEKVNFLDYSILAEHWLEGTTP